MSASPAQLRQAAPRLEIRLAGERHLLFLSGSWTVPTLNASSKQAESFKQLPDARLVAAMDMRGVTALDTAGAMLVNKIRLLPRKGEPLPLVETDQAHLDILALCLPPQESNAARDKTFVLPPPDRPRHARYVLPLYCLGERMTALAVGTGERLSFFGRFLVVLGKNIARPGEARWVSIIHNMEQTGVNAIPIVALLSFLIGMVLSYMAASQLAGFGAQIFVVNLLEVAIMREMGVLLTAILVAGRSGSSYTAQIGAMAANQEIDAMRSIGLDPMHMLVVPRVTALVATLPMLVMVADVSGLLGGLVAVWFSLDITPGMFIEALQRAFNLQHFAIGLGKAPFFAAIIGCIGCFDGFKARRSADSVGRMTTRSVVESIFMVIALDAFFAVFLTSVGI
ncbi:MAG: ABC transporter permease [Deltaproteobacteria bacterium]|jgi:phospholipid/cholesterol/gamma-HCH transport system permease protein|nr:ABC transporter permease [Deltaproteobacteria bacterium]